MWKSIVQGTDDSIVRGMRIAACKRKAANTHSEYVILIALPLQQCLHERVSVLRYTGRSLPVWLYVSLMLVFKGLCVM
jgi:hypothetical protein